MEKIIPNPTACLACNDCDREEKKPEHYSPTEIYIQQLYFSLQAECWDLLCTLSFKQFGGTSISSCSNPRNFRYPWSDFQQELLLLRQACVKHLLLRLVPLNWTPLPHIKVLPGETERFLARYSIIILHLLFTKVLKHWMLLWEPERGNLDTEGCVLGRSFPYI